MGGRYVLGHRFSAPPPLPSWLACIMEAQHFHCLFRTLRDSDLVASFHGRGVRAHMSRLQMALGKCRQMLLYEMEAAVRAP